MKKGLFFIVLLLSNLIFSQEEKSAQSFGINDDVKILDEPLSFYNYFSEYQLNNDFLLRTGLRERNTGNYSFLEVPVLVKYFITDKFSVLLGPKLNIIKNFGTIESENTSLFSTFGIQYDVTKQFSIEGRVNYMLTEPSASTKTLFEMNTAIYKLGTRIRF